MRKYKTKIPRNAYFTWLSGDSQLAGIELLQKLFSYIPFYVARYEQGMIDLNILEKGDNYKDLKRSGEGLYDFADELSGKI